MFCANMCEIHGETFDEPWANSVPDDLPQPDSLVHSSTHCGSTSIREALVQYFSDDNTHLHMPHVHIYGYQVLYK